ncbi:MAG: S8 family serine peptidase [Polyangiaceae bacterium]|nr:S8 family serine peptidase [Polyangiaceae bacterium]
MKRCATAGCALALGVAMALWNVGCSSTAELEGGEALGRVVQPVEEMEALNTGYQTDVETAELIVIGEAGKSVRAQPAPLRRWRGASLEEKPEGQRIEAVDANAEVLRSVEALPADELVSLTVTMEDVATDWQYFVAYRDDDDARHHFAENRQILLDIAQLPIREWLWDRGYETTGYWLANQIHTVVPASMVPEILERDGVIGISLDAQGFEAGNGLYSTDGTLASAFHAASRDGRQGNRLDGKTIRVGVVERVRLNRDHKGWLGPRFLNTQLRFSRLAKHWDCSYAPCVAESLSGLGDSEYDNHGTMVTSVATGSIEDGQDSAFPGSYTEAQRKRSGHLPRSAIYYYWSSRESQADGSRRAIDRAVLDGVDVLNISLYYDTFPTATLRCNSTANASGINEAISAALEAGTLVVVAAGNDGSSKCTVNYPALRTQAIAVGGLHTLNTNVSYGSTVMAAYSARGGLPIRTFQAISSTTPAIELSAPGAFQYLYRNTSNNGYYGDYYVGTSFAAPVVTAAAGAIRNAFHAIGTSIPGKALFVNMLLMGDGWDGDTLPTAPDMRVGISPYSGTGRLRMHRPDEPMGPGQWAYRSFTIQQGQWVAWPVGSGALGSTVNQWKWAATWFESDLQNVADIDFYVYDVCPPGGGEELIALDATYRIGTRFDLKKAELTGKCLEMRAYGYSVPRGGRTIWSANYYHSAPVANH